MYIERALSEKVHLALQHFPALVLTGARQVGKSTFLNKLLPEHSYVSLDSPLVAEEAETNPEIFLRKHPPPVIVDEVQYAPGLFRSLKIEIDKRRSDYGQFVLTGSQKFELMKGVSDSLAGRIAVLELEGLGLAELEGSNLLDTGLNFQKKLLLQGGFPQLWAEDNVPLNLFFSSYTGTYLERDVRQIVAVNSLRDFERFLRACALRSGNLLNKSELARDVGISVSTAGEWLGVLHALGQIVLLEPWFSNLGKRLSKSPKLYLADCGLLCHLMGVTDSNLLESPAIGAIWETFVFAELRKQLTRIDKNLRIWFYRDQGQLEVDFLVEHGSQLAAYEVKWSEAPSSREGSNLNRLEKTFLKKGDFRIEHKVLLSRASEEIQRDNGIQLRPVQKALDIFR